MTVMWHSVITNTYIPPDAFKSLYVITAYSDSIIIKIEFYFHHDVSSSSAYVRMFLPLCALSSSFLRSSFCPCPDIAS